MSESIERLRSLTPEELFSKYDKVAQHTSNALILYRDEIHRRDNEKISKAMLKYTKWITIMTAVIFVATAANICINVFC